MKRVTLFGSICLRPPSKRVESVQDVYFSADGGGGVIGVRFMLRDDSEHIQTAICRGLNYADESARSLDSVITGECSDTVGAVPVVL